MVKTIRFYSDTGVVPPAQRTGAGYRLYDTDALARLAFVRTLRDLGIDLATIRKVLEREVGVANVAAAHADALDAVADREPTPKEMETMHRLARLSDDERRRIIHAFLDEVFGGLELDGGLEARMRSTMPELPDEPSPEQVDAWIELAELVSDDDFRRRMRAMAEHASAEHSDGGAAGARRDRGPVRRGVGGGGLCRVPFRTRGPVRERLGPARRALLAAAGCDQRLAADPDDVAGVGVDRGGVAGGVIPSVWRYRRTAADKEAGSNG
jgi:DNA-binding transcriptional MerR regulator